MGVNKFVDLTEDEFKAYRMKKGAGKRRRSKMPSSENFLEEKIDVDSLPNYVDWRNSGVLTPIKD